MLYNLIETKRGKNKVLMTDSLPKVNDRIKALRAGSRGMKVSFKVEEATEETEKYKKKPSNHRWSGGDAQAGPRKVKWN